jgi:hypothetical protein
MTSTVKVNNVQASDGGNIINQCGTNITLGASGDTIALATGASQTGFGRTGTVDWQTAIKTSTITVVNGEGYFVNTTGGAITANLPAGSAGAIAAFRDYANTFDTNKLTISSNGSEKINGDTLDLEVTTEGESITLVYADATKGWLVVNDGNNDAGAQAQFVTATGGTITTVCTDYKVHTFTGPGTFCVSSVGNAAGSNTVSYMVIGGGAGAGSNAGGGGGAGGFREGRTTTCSYTVSPLNAPAGLPVSATAFPIVVGGGGAGSTSVNAAGVSGSTSSFSTISSAGGGGGGTGTSPQAGVAGASGGGARANTSQAGGAGNTPPVSPPQGNAGGATGPGSGPTFVGGGGGGAGGTGCSGHPGPGAGGIAATTSINATPTARASGGGGGSNACSTSGGGSTPGGGGTGGNNPATGTAGTANTGGGGGGSGGGASPNNGAAGGSGIVIIRYKFQ